MNIFYTDWWQNAVDRKVSSRFGIRFILMPQLTPCVPLMADAEKLGVWYHYEQTSPRDGYPNSFETKGYTIMPRRTYQLTDLSDMEKVRRNYSENKRRQLKKAATLNVDTQLTAEEFIELHTDWLEKRGTKCTYSKEFFLNLATKCREHDSCQIITLRDSDNTPLAAAFLVYDDEWCYYLVPAYNPDFAKSGAGARIAHESILFAAGKGLKFDFEGSMDDGIALHYKQFGATEATYWSVEKCFNRLFKVLLWAKRLKGQLK